MSIVLKKRWRRGHALWAALGLIVATNAVALLGVWVNRSGEAESRLIVSERELWPSSNWRLDGENSATTLRLRWRVPRYQSQERDWIYQRSYANSGGAAQWCDRAKLESLGFSLDDEDGLRLTSYYYSRLSKEVLLVLEYNGEAYRQELERARRIVQREQSAESSDEGKRSEQERRLETARNTLEAEEQKNSRLFVIDAGLELAALRGRYPDRSRYAIVRGEVRPWLVGSGEERKVMGYVSAIDNDLLTVPYGQRKRFEPVYSERRRVLSEKVPHYQVELAFGRRLEPWIVGINWGAGQVR